MATHAERVRAAVDYQEQINALERLKRSAVNALGVDTTTGAFGPVRDFRERSWAFTPNKNDVAKDIGFVEVDDEYGEELGHTEYLVYKDTLVGNFHFMEATLYEEGPRFLILSNDKRRG